MSRDESPASFGGIAIDALEAAHAAQNTADRALSENTSHEKICAERYLNINTQITATNTEIGRIRAILVWAGTTAFAIIIALLGFTLKAQYDSVTELRTAAYQRQELRQQMTDLPPRVTIQAAPGQPITGATIERQPQP